MIYFVLDSAQDAVKIGYTSRIDLRLPQLQTGSVNELRVIKTLPGTLADEQNLHRKFNHLRIRGEWFRYTGELKAFIDGSTNDDGKPSQRSTRRDGLISIGEYIDDIEIALMMFLAVGILILFAMHL